MFIYFFNNNKKNLKTDKHQFFSNVPMCNMCFEHMFYSSGLSVYVLFMDMCFPMCVCRNVPRLSMHPCRYVCIGARVCVPMNLSVRVAVLALYDRV